MKSIAVNFGDTNGQRVPKGEVQVSWKILKAIFEILFLKFRQVCIKRAVYL